MINHWKEFGLDSRSFWIGFILGLLLFGFFRYLIPRFRLALPWISAKINLLNSRTSEVVEQQYCEDLVQITQRMHLSASIFSLNEIFIEPAFFFPPAAQSNEEDVFVELADIVIPYMPDWPELAAFYQGRSLPLKYILDSEANVAILGHPGTGKSVALAYMASLIAARDKNAGKPSRRLPILIHAADLISGEQTEIRPFDRIINLVQSQFPRINSSRLKTLLSKQIKSGNVVLFLDGYDELPPSDQVLATKFIAAILEEYPMNRVIVAVDVIDLSGLRNLPIIPVTISPWNARQRREFLTKWINNWRMISASISGNHLSEEDQYLFTSWLMNDQPFTTPLETTLKVWAVTAGDLSNPSLQECINLFIQRFLTGDDQPAKYQELAIRMISTQSLSLDHRKHIDKSSAEESPPNFVSQIPTSIITKQSGKKKWSKTSNRTGLLNLHPSGLVSFIHPLIPCYLASAALSRTPILHYFENQPDWIGKRLTSGFLFALGKSTSESIEVTERDKDPFLKSLLIVSRWLQYSQANTNFQSKIFKILTEEIQHPNHSKSVRLRLLAALLCSRDSGLNVLFRNMMKSPHADVRLAGALGLGFIKDHPSIPLIGELLADKSPGVAEAACLALSAIGIQQALNILGTALLTGGENVKVYAAIALAFSSPDGHDMLKEASRTNDFLVRRAAVFGLARITEPWAREIIEELTLNDDQWLVRDVASQALNFKNSQMPNPIRPLPELVESAWLIEFAGSKGLGVSPGKSAKQMLHAVLKEGNPVQKRSALEYLRLNGEAEFLSEIIDCMINADDPTREMAVDVLWHNLAMGLKHPFVSQ